MIISGDTYCERTRFISGDEQQRAELLRNEGLWRTLVQQIADSNDTFVAACVPKTTP